MIVIGNYGLTYYKNKNQIVISLPQTVFTTTNTFFPVEDRIIDIDEKEFIPILISIMSIFKKEK